MGMGVFEGFFGEGWTHFLNMKPVQYLRSPDAGRELFRNGKNTVANVVKDPKSLLGTFDSAMPHLGYSAGKTVGIGNALSGNLKGMWGMNAVRGAAITGGVGGIYGAATDSDDRVGGFVRGSSIGVGASLAGRGALTGGSYLAGRSQKGLAFRASAQNKLMNVRNSMLDGSFRTHAMASTKHYAGKAGEYVKGMDWKSGPGGNGYGVADLLGDLAAAATGSM